MPASRYNLILYEHPKLALIALTACRSWLPWAGDSCPFCAFALTWLLKAPSLAHTTALLFGMFFNGAVKLVATALGRPMALMVVIRF